MFAKLRNFFVESRQELKQVHWPTRQEAVYLTLVVIVSSAVIAAFLGGLDFLFTDLLKIFILK